MYSVRYTSALHVPRMSTKPRGRPKGKTVKKMANTLDLNLALKLVKPFAGNPTDLSSYKESVELLRDYSKDVSETHILRLMKVTLTGAAHGAIDGATTIDEAFVFF